MLTFIYMSILAYFFCGPASIAEKRGTIIPLYSWPTTDSGGNAWKPLLDAYKQYPIEVWAIVNVDSGPGKAKDSDYGPAISNLMSVGIKTLGYVSSNYTRRSTALIKKDIDLWKTWYNTTGIFLDEMTDDDNTSHMDFYASLNAYSKSRKFSFTVGNPGTNVPLGYFKSVDTVMIYESPGFPTQKAICDKSYKQLPDTSPLGIFPYGVSKLNETAILKAKECVGYIYVTNDGGSNPWDTLPAYLPKLFEILSR